MDKSNNVTHIAWRGSSQPDRQTSEAVAVGDGGSTVGRVLLLMGAGGNRERLAALLRDFCEVVQPRTDAIPEESFDLVVTDLAAFRSWHARLRDAKVREEPTFLPVVLVVSRGDLKRQLRSFWDTVDEFIVTPIEPREFAERISMLLRARQLAVAQRSHLAYVVNHDRTTGLPNKNLFMDRLMNAVRDASILGKRVHVSVVHIPLSRILKSLGHQGLERAATTCSSRLRALLGDDVSLARLTTEQWGLIHPPGTDIESVMDVCSRICGLSDQALEIENERLHVAPRIGIGVYPDDAPDAAGTLDCAISALSEANDSVPVFYSRDVQHQALRFIRTEARLHEALDGQQFEVWFQPQLDLADGGVVGTEALVRWRLPSGDLVPPGEFMGVAESTGLIREVDRWVLEASCEAMSRWRDDHVDIRRVSVNVSSEDVKAPDFADHVEQTLERYGLPPSTLELELTETTLFEIANDSLEKLIRLRRQGISIAADDFGTGYSSLSYIHRLPITTLKIDKAFVDDINHNENNAAITRTIVWLAKNFKLETVAEGIESRAQAAYLAALDVKVGQGFLYARPMPDAELRQWLKRQNTRTG